MAEIIDSNQSAGPAYKSTESQVSPRPSLGEVKLNTDLIPTIALYAAVETKGIVSLTGKHSAPELTSKKELDKGVTINKEEELIHVDLEVDLEFGYNIYESCLRCQQNVKNAIENMSGFTVGRVDIRVRGIVPQKNPPAIPDEAGRPY
jgi:uncharacterized alkaline shock family protein YloU